MGDDGSGRRGPERWAPLALLLMAVLGVALVLRGEGGPAPARAPGATGPAVAGPGAPEVALAPPPAAGPGAGPTVLPFPGPGPAGAGPGPGPVVGGPVGAVVAAPAADPVDPDAPANRATGVRGRVVTRTGAPVEGAKVHLRGRRPGPQGGAMLVVRPGPDGELEATAVGETRSREATTGADGAFEVLGLDAAYRYEVRVAPPEGYLRAAAPAPALRAGAVVEARDVAVGRAGRLEGVVRGPDGRPLAGARVALGDDEGVIGFAGPAGAGEGEAGGTFTVRRAVAIAGPADGPGGEGGPSLPLLGGRAATSDAAGRFAFERLAPGVHVVRGDARGLRAARVEVELAEGEAKRDVELRLAEGLALSVRVVDAAGAPVAGATVRALAGFGLRGGGPGVTTDAQGAARVEGLSTSELTLQVEAPGHAASTTEVVLGAGDPATARVVVLEAGAAVTGRLVDAAGAPVARGFVLLEPRVHGGDVEVVGGGDGRPGPDGRFRLRGVRRGAWRLRAHAPGLAMRLQDVEVGDRPEVDLGDVRLDALVAAEVLVLDPDGAPCPDAVVDAGQGGDGVMMVAVVVDAGPGGGEGTGEGGPAFASQRQGRAGPDGRARLQGLEPGVYTLRATRAPFADGWGELRLGPDGAPAPVTVRLTRGGAVEGRVLPAPGEGAAPPTTVRLLRRGRAAPVATTTSGEGGAFAFERVAPGEYSLALGGVGADDGGWFTVVEGQATTRTLERPPAATLEGVVRDAGGAALADVEVALGALDAGRPRGPALVPGGRRTRTDAAGRYRFEGVALRPWGLEVAAGARRATFAVDVAAAGAVRRDLTLLPEGAGSPVTVGVDADGAPRGGATVVLERAGDGPLVRRQATTAADGVARLEGVPAGPYVVTATAPGRARARATLEVAGPTDGPRLALGPTGALLLDVRAAADVGPRTAHVVARPQGGAGAPGEARFAEVTLGAVVRVDGLTPGQAYEVVVSAPGLREARVTLVPGVSDPAAPEVVTLAPE